MRIESGNKHFYQWDINQRLVIDTEAVKEVHFSNALSKTAFVCEVYEENQQRFVNVPNILLTQRCNIRAYGCCGECVRKEAVYGVTARDKPADYVYTETEVKRYEDLEKRIANLEKGGSAGVDLSNYYTKEETNNAIAEATKADTYELIETITIDEDVRAIKRIIQLHAVMVTANFPTVSEPTNVFLKCDFEKGEVVTGSAFMRSNGSASVRFVAEKKGAIWDLTSQGYVRGWGSGQIYGQGNASDIILVAEHPIIENITVYASDGIAVIPAGTTIKIWGVRA